MQPILEGFGVRKEVRVPVVAAEAGGASRPDRLLLKGSTAEITYGIHTQQEGSLMYLLAVLERRHLDDLRMSCRDYLRDSQQGSVLYRRDPRRRGAHVPVVIQYEHVDWQLVLWRDVL